MKQIHGLCLTIPILEENGISHFALLFLSQEQIYIYSFLLYSISIAQCEMIVRVQHINPAYLIIRVVYRNPTSTTRKIWALNQFILLIVKPM